MERESMRYILYMNLSVYGCILNSDAAARRDSSLIFRHEDRFPRVI